MLTWVALSLFGLGQVSPAATFNLDDVVARAHHELVTFIDTWRPPARLIAVKRAAERADPTSRLMPEDTPLGRFLWETRLGEGGFRADQMARIFIDELLPHQDEAWRYHAVNVGLALAPVTRSRGMVEHGGRRILHALLTDSLYPRVRRRAAAALALSDPADNHEFVRVQAETLYLKLYLEETDPFVKAGLRQLIGLWMPELAMEQADLSKAAWLGLCENALGKKSATFDAMIDKLHERR